MDMKHIKQDLSLKAWVWPPWWARGGIEAEIQLFQNMVMIANILSLHTSSTPGQNIFLLEYHASTYSVLKHHQLPDGVQGQNIFFKVVMLHIKLMGMEHRAP